MRRNWFTAATCGLTMLSGTMLAAAPPGRSLHRVGQPPIASVPLPSAAAGAAAAATAAAPRGISSAASDTARATNGFSRASGSLSRAASAIGKAPASTAPGRLPAGTSVPLFAQSGHGFEAVRAAAQHTLDNRLRQADHLAEVAKQNGNAHLAETAERIRVEAKAQFDAAVRRVDARLAGGTDVTEPTTDATTQPDSDAGIDVGASRAPAPQLPAIKPSWRDRLHFARPFSR